MFLVVIKTVIVEMFGTRLIVQLKQVVLKIVLLMGLSLMTGLILMELRKYQEVLKFV